MPRICPGPDEQASIDGLMGHACILIVGMPALQPARDLLRWPLALKLARSCPAERSPTSKLAQPGVQSPVPGSLIRPRSAIARKDRCAPSPPEISSRSQCVNAGRDLVCASGRIPPVRDSKGKIDDELRSSPRPIERIDSPRCRRSQISAFRLSVK